MLKKEDHLSSLATSLNTIHGKNLKTIMGEDFSFYKVCTKYLEDGHNLIEIVIKRDGSNSYVLYEIDCNYYFEGRQLSDYIWNNLMLSISLSKYFTTDAVKVDNS